MFMKTHKCGSSSLQNVFLRFGDTHDLFFALPKIDNYFGHPIRFNRRLLLDPALLRKRYNLTYSILAHHLRFNYKELAFVLPEDTIFITILRDPIRLFESLFIYYDYSANSLGSNVTLHEFALLFDRDSRFAASIGAEDEAAAAAAARETQNNEQGHARTSLNSNQSEGGNSEKIGQSVQSSSPVQSSRSSVKQQQAGSARSGWTWASLFNTILMGPMNRKAGAGGDDGAADGQHEEENGSTAAAGDPADADDKLTDRCHSRGR